MEKWLNSSLPDQQSEPPEPRAETVSAQRRRRRRQVRAAVRPLRALGAANHAAGAARDHALRQKVPPHLSCTGKLIFIYIPGEETLGLLSNNNIG